jgi:uncharacterized protein YutE (UPF0331/DUF86 family)/predicted nucleotidyltransferase
MDEAQAAAATAEAVAALRKAGARFGYLFGSRASGTNRPGSDVDIAAYFGDRPPESFELLLPPGVDLLVLDRAPLELAGRVAAGGRLLFEADPVARVRWEATTRKIYFDELPRITRAHREFAASVSSRRRAVVDEARVLSLLRSVTDDVDALKQEAAADEARRRDPMWLRGVKYAFITAIEACIDVAQHICAAQGWGPPADNGDAARLLGKHGVLRAELADSVRRAIGFRNVLVHEYVEVNDAIVIDRLGHLGDLDEFVRQVAAYVTRG